MAHDLLIMNGNLVDGTGAAAYQADIAVNDGVISEIGRIREGAERVIDASDLAVAPGFIDHHTHYDAQICWDQLITCSPWHGVTSVVMGNCGVGLAPCRPDAHEIAAWDLVNVEAIPFDVLGAGVNLGFMAPLTPFRHYVMGEESMEREATDDETRSIVGLLREAMQAGALGFSTTFGPQHIGYQGRPLACRQASRAELTAYCNVLRDLGRGIVELNLNDSPGLVTEEEYTLLELFLEQSGRPVTWLSLLQRDDQPELCRATLEQTAPLLARGARPQVSCRPLIVQIDLRNPFAYANLPEWKVVFNRPPEEQMKHYRNPEFRAAFRRHLQGDYIFKLDTYFKRLEVKEVRNPALRGLVGKSIESIAAERGADPVDTFFDINVEDGLGCDFSLEALNSEEAGVRELINHPQTLIGLSDGGAHVDMLCDAGYCTYLLGTWVRERQAMTLERAVQRITSEPADLFGISDRGRIEVGKAADFAIFDTETVGSDKRPEMWHDLPAGGRRMVMPARGMHYTVVNGEVLFEEQKHSGALPGQVLRGS
jgi:N-acyl-D-aspartate/D-glutamate deacylase